MTGFVYPFMSLIFLSCNAPQARQEPVEIRNHESLVQEHDPNLTRVRDIPLPAGFTRLPASTGEFANWLRALPLKQEKRVYLFDGSLKPNQDAQYGVLDVSVSNENLQQCADAVMRLRAEWLYDQQRYDEILFIDNEGGRYAFESPYSRARFDQYLRRVFGMCGTASLSKQMRRVSDPSDIEPGMVFIRGGFPGHAVLVMDVAESREGERIFLLAQSYMPAQDIHVLRNPMDETLSPWYRLRSGETLYTPEYTFQSAELKKW